MVWRSPSRDEGRGRGSETGAPFNLGLDKPSSFCVRPQEKTNEESEWKCESSTIACTTSDRDHLPSVRHCKNQIQIAVIVVVTVVVVLVRALNIH